MQASKGFDVVVRQVVKEAILSCQPDQAVGQVLSRHRFATGRVVLVAVGKAAWAMARAAEAVLGDRISGGVVITKYDHAMGPIGPLQVFEAGHPVPDDNSVLATEAAIHAVTGLTADDTVLFLVSGGGSALFEKPLVPLETLADVTRQMLKSGADIVSINTVRKRLSAVKGGRFAKLCAPAKVLSIVLSDIVGDPLDMIASGPAYPDSASAADAAAVVRRFGLEPQALLLPLMAQETPKTLHNVTTHITGSVRQLCLAATRTLTGLGFEVTTLTDCLQCEAREAGRFLAAIAKTHADTVKPLAFLAGGETVVTLTGTGKGGRNQELALSAALDIAGLDNVSVFSFGSDGTDGPTDAAGGWVDGQSVRKMRDKGLDARQMLHNNDAYHALKAVDGLIMTGPTGTNVNDLSVVLVLPKA